MQDVTEQAPGLTPTIRCNVLIADCVDQSGAAYIDVQFMSDHPGVRESTANLFTAWLAANWDELLVMFRRQLKDHAKNQERKQRGQDVEVIAPAPKILAADGKGYISSEDCPQITDIQMDLPFEDSDA